MTLSEFSVTIPGWLTLVTAVASLLLSIQMFRWYLEQNDPYPFFTVQLPFLAETEESREVEGRNE